MTDSRELTTKQLKAIPEILAARTYEEGCRAAKISKTCFYEWMQNDAFRTELERQRNELVETAFAIVAQNIQKAVSALVGLPDTADDRVKRLTANDIISHFLKHKELVELEARIAVVEERLEGGR